MLEFLPIPSSFFAPNPFLSTTVFLSTDYFCFMLNFFAGSDPSICCCSKCALVGASLLRSVWFWKVLCDEIVFLYASKLCTPILGVGLFDFFKSLVMSNKV